MQYSPLPLLSFAFSDNMAPRFPCIICSKGVLSNSSAVSCDICNQWCHIKHQQSDQHHQSDQQHQLTPTGSPLHREPTPVPEEMEDFDQPAPPRPLDRHETSVEDPAPQLIQEDEAEVTCKIVDESSIRGKTKLFDSVDYSYTIRRQTSQSTTWRCSIRTKSVNCPATI